MGPVYLLQIEVRWFLFLLVATLAWKMLTRGIVLSGLLARKQDGGQVSPERIQLLLATLALSAKYIGEAAHGGVGAMPDVPPNWLYMFAGSSGIYASVKAITAFGRK